MLNTMKTCSKCKAELEATLENFAANKKNPDGLQYHCRKCQYEYKKQWREKYKEEQGESDSAKYSREHREDLAKHRAKYAERNRQIVLALKQFTPCADCHYRYPPVCMDFDHVKGEKKDNVTRLQHEGASVKRLMEEIDKCELVCANCHRIRTAQREKPWTEELRVYDRSDWDNGPTAVTLPFDLWELIEKHGIPHDMVPLT